MINTTEIQRVHETQPTEYWTELKRYAQDAPLTTLGLAAGAGVLAYALLKPAPKSSLSRAKKFARQMNGNHLQASASRTLKTAVGSLVLSYLGRRLRSKMAWR